MNICFSARSAYGSVTPKIYYKLHEFDSNINGVFVCDDASNQRKLKTKFPDLVIVNFTDYINENWDRVKLDDLSYYECKYDCRPIWKYIYTDRFLVDRKYLDVVRISICLFMFYEKLFSEYCINFYYDETIATLHSYIAYLVGLKCQTQYIGQMTFRKLETKKHYFFEDPYQHMLGFDKNYLSKKYDDNIIKSVCDYINDFRNSSGKSDIMQFVKSRPKFEIKWLLYGIYLYTKKEQHDKCDYTNYKYYRYFFRRSTFLFRYLKVKKYYKEPDLDKKYVYLPLHYQPEASTLVCAQKYEKQLFFIDQIAKSLPADTVLYVKEHYALLGHRDPEFYRQLEKYPNVYIIDPYYSSLLLIKSSTCVMTLTGTAGWEAMLLKKPVILCGKIYFDNAPGIIYNNDIYLNFEKLLQEWKEPGDDDLTKYLCECFENIYDGCVYFSKKTFLSDDNINNVSESLFTVLSKYSFK